MSDSKNNQDLRLRLLPDRPVLVLSGEFRSDPVQSALFELSEAIAYYRYDTCQFLFNSPGGEVVALAQIEEAMYWMRAQGIGIITTAHGRAHSAAALALSLGDPGWRIARARTTLLYHRGRYELKEKAILEPDTIDRMQADQNHFLARHIHLLDLRARGIADDSPAVAPAPATEPKSDLTSGFVMQINSGTSAKTTFAGKATDKRTDNYRELFIREVLLSVDQAQQLELIDHVVDNPNHAMAHWFHGFC